MGNSPRLGRCGGNSPRLIKCNCLAGWVHLTLGNNPPRFQGGFKFQNSLQPASVRGVSTLLRLQLIISSSILSSIE